MEADYRVYTGSSTVLLIKVGLNGSTAGYHDKYLKIANRINKEKGYSVIIAPNNEGLGNKIDKDIKAVKGFVPGCEVIYYVGVSNGASLGMEYGHLYPKIKEMLLINGPLIMNWHRLKSGIEQFSGEKITFVYGDGDQSYKYSKLVSMVKTKADSELLIVKGADHNFVGMEEIFISIICSKMI